MLSTLCTRSMPLSPIPYRPSNILGRSFVTNQRYNLNWPRRRVCASSRRGFHYLYSPRIRERLSEKGVRVASEASILVVSSNGIELLGPVSSVFRLQSRAYQDFSDSLSRQLGE